METGREVLTKTKQDLLEKRSQQVTTPEKVYSLDTIASNAQILSECGGQAALIFRAIIGSYKVSSPELQREGFKLSSAFRKATNLPARQIQRATQLLEAAGYIKRDIQPGKKMLIRLTPKGAQALLPCDPPSYRNVQRSP
jgi:DNA-binding MarR family transcriptional regulator